MAAMTPGDRDGAALVDVEDDDGDEDDDDDDGDGLAPNARFE